MFYWITYSWRVRSPYLLCKPICKVGHVALYSVLCELKLETYFLTIYRNTKNCFREHILFTAITGRERNWLVIMWNVDFYSIWIWYAVYAIQACLIVFQYCQYFDYTSKSPIPFKTHRKLKMVNLSSRHWAHKQRVLKILN